MKDKERLTNKTDDNYSIGCECPFALTEICNLLCDEQSFVLCKDCNIGKYIGRLAEYEDLGTVEEIKQLKQNYANEIAMHDYEDEEVTQ